MCQLIETMGYDPQKAAEKVAADDGFEGSVASIMIADLLSKKETIEAAQKKLQESREYARNLENQFG
ncbi:hypothetical protein ACFL6I_10120 [candidate division KSB1 bacterium]